MTSPHQKDDPLVSGTSLETYTTMASTSNPYSYYVQTTGRPSRNSSESSGSQPKLERLSDLKTLLKSNSTKSSSSSKKSSPTLVPNKAPLKAPSPSPPTTESSTTSSSTVSSTTATVASPPPPPPPRRSPALPPKPLPRQPPAVKAPARNSGSGPAGYEPNSSCLRKLRACQAELERLRLEMWKESERKALISEKKEMELAEARYQSQIRQWETAQAECEKDRKRRKALLKYIVEKRKEKKEMREEASKWRSYHRKMSRDENQRMAQEFQENEEKRFMQLMKIYTKQEDKLLNSQMKPRHTEGMKSPELEELRRMFAPVARGPNELFEYYVLEPQPTDCELKRAAEQKVAAMLGLRNTHGIHLNLSDRFKKRTTIQLAMGPRFGNGERDQLCNITSQPGALCTKNSPSTTSLPNVPIPNCLEPLMKTLPYRVEQMDSPLMKLQTFGPGPNFNGSRLYGTIVLPKGQSVAPYYTDPYSVTF